MIEDCFNLICIASSPSTSSGGGSIKFFPVKNVGAYERNVELNLMPERRSVTECDGAMSERDGGDGAWRSNVGAMSERDGTMTDVASTYVLCPRFEEPGVR